MLRGRSAMKPKTKFQRLALLLPTLTPIKPFKKSEIKSRTVKGNKQKIAYSILPKAKVPISQTFVINPKIELKDNTTIIIPSSSMNSTLLESTKNLYKSMIEHNLILHNKEKEENEEKKLNSKLKANIPRPNKKYKIVDLNKQVKGMIPKIDDLEEFANEIQRKHKGLFEKIIPLLFKHQQMPLEQKKVFEIPLLLYEDYKYFVERFFPHKYAIKAMSFADSNMLYPSLIDYNSYIKIFKEYLSYFKQDNFTENAFNFDNAFYLDLLNRLTRENKMKVVAIVDKDKENGDKDRLHEKFQRFMKDYNNAFQRQMSKDDIDKSENWDEDNAIRSILKKKHNEEGKKRGSMFRSDTDNGVTEDLKELNDKQDIKQNEKRNEKDNGQKITNADNNNNHNDELDYSSSDKDEFLELHSKADSKMSNSYLDNSYIFQKNKNKKENQLKFSLRIMKNIQLDEKKVESLYDKYFAKMNQKQLQRSYD